MNRSGIAVSLVVLLAALAAHAQSNSQKSFASVKALAGTWEGKNQTGDAVQVSYKLTAGDSAVMSDITTNKPGHNFDMITMFNMDGGRMLMTHYCSAGNQPRMQAKLSPDGKTLTFDFVDATNLSAGQPGHMQRVIFTFVDANHHIEEWHFATSGKEIVERFDLQKKS